MENKAEKIMAMLRYELEMENRCYERSLEAYEKTRNPIKKRRHKRALDMFQSHVAELAFVINRIERELKD